MAPALRLKNDFDVLQVRLHPFFFARLVSMSVSAASLRRSVRKAGQEQVCVERVHLVDLRLFPLKDKKQVVNVFRVKVD